MTKKALKRKKATKKLDKAVRKAVDKGLSQTVVEATVEHAIGDASEKVPSEKVEVEEAEDPSIEGMTSKSAKKQLTK
jgi:hypothetical protein